MITEERRTELVEWAMWDGQLMYCLRLDVKPNSQRAAFPKPTAPRPSGTEETRYYERKRNAIAELFPTVARLTRMLPENKRLKAIADMTQEEIQTQAAWMEKTAFKKDSQEAEVWRRYCDGMTQRAVAASMKNDGWKISIGKVHTILHDLERRGLLRVRRSKGGAGSHVGNTYRKNHTIMDRTHTAH